MNVGGDDREFAFRSKMLYLCDGNVEEARKQRVSSTFFVQKMPEIVW